MTKYKETHEEFISKEIKKYQNKTLLDSFGKRCRIKEFSIYKGDKMVKLIICYGFEGNEITETFGIPYNEILIKLESFTIAPKIDNSEILNKEPLKLKIIKPLEMSEQTEDNLTGLRTHLFNAIRKLEGGTMKNEEAKAMAQVAQVIINSAKLEMEFKQLTNDKPTINMID